MVDITAYFNDEDLALIEAAQKSFKHVPSAFKLDKDPNNPRIAIIRTSDRIAFKGCRRRWGWSSHLRHNLGPRTGIAPLWLGTGFHFALEDFHGYNRFGHPKAAFEAYVKASQVHAPHKMPDDLDEIVELGRGMLDYYIIWLQQRPHSLLKTLWIDGVPQVEVNFRFRIPGDWTKYGYDEVWYSGTIDRVCLDDNGLIWPVDYKTAKNIEVMHFLTDPQVSSYMWAVPHIYDQDKYPVGGFKYMQFRKSLPNPGRILQNGTVSNAANQGTNYYMYRQTLIQVYGSVEQSLDSNQAFLKGLMMYQDDNKDEYIQIDNIGRNDRHGQSEGTKIIMECEDMLNPELPLYPNPTRWCAHWQYSCPFLSPCTSLDDGGDWLHELEMTTEEREPKYDGWRDKLVWPGDIDPEAAKTLDMSDRSWLDTGDVIEDDPNAFITTSSK